jgi:uncharacterized membrane protein YfcA
MALLGGHITLQKVWFEYLLGALLLVAGVLSLVRRPVNDQAIRPPRKPVALAWGATIGLASGLTGVGGGVLITPPLPFVGGHRVIDARRGIGATETIRGAAPTSRSSPNHKG